MEGRSTGTLDDLAPLVVVVEGSADEMCLISESLKNSGYRVLGYADGEKAYKRIIEELPSLAIIDAHFSSGGALRLIEKISAEDSLATMPVIAVVTGNADMDSVGERADVFLARPFDKELLLQTVDRLIRGKRP